MFTSLLIGVGTQIRSKSTPFFYESAFHGTSHKQPSHANFKLWLTPNCKLDGLFQTTFTYYSSSPKMHLEHGNLAKILETKGLKLLYNAKIGWISM